LPILTFEKIAQNVGVENPGWLSGGVQVLPNLTLPYNRLAILAFAAPTTNSYKRLVPGFEAPVYVCWARRNRSALVRVPLYHPGKEKATQEPAADPIGWISGLDAEVVPEDDATGLSITMSRGVVKGGQGG
jgi:hypothetical protein